MASRIDEKWVLDRINEVVIVGERGITSSEIYRRIVNRPGAKFRRLNAQIYPRFLRNCWNYQPRKDKKRSRFTWTRLR
mgnify:FL=1